MKLIRMTSGKEHYAMTDPFQSSEFNGAPYPEGHPNEGKPMFSIPLVIFLDIQGNQQSLVASEIESITDINVAVENKDGQPGIVVPKGVPEELLKRND